MSDVSGNTIYRYPLKPPVSMGNSADADGRYPSSFYKAAEAPTEAIDYLVLKRSRSYFSNNEASGLNQVSGEGAARNANRGSIKRKMQDGVVYMAMPPQLSTAYQPTYRRVDQGIVGLATSEFLKQREMHDMASTLQSAAGAIAPEFASATLASLVSSFGGALGLGGQFDANTFQQMQGGRVFNPFAEQTFNSMAFRTHSFNFKLLARSQKEADMIWNIIKWIKLGSVPEIQSAKDESLEKTLRGGGAAGNQNIGSKDSEAGDKIKDKLESAGKNQRFLKIPDQFDIRMMRMDPNSSSSWWKGQGGGTKSDYKAGKNQNRNLHFKIHPSFCTGVGVNYTPDGQYTSFKTIHGEQVNVPAVALSLQFTETRLINKQDILDGF